MRCVEFFPKGADGFGLPDIPRAPKADNGFCHRLFVFVPADSLLAVGNKKESVESVSSIRMEVVEYLD